MSGYWLTCYDANGRRLGAAAPYSSREAAGDAAAVIFAISEKVREAVIWTKNAAGFGAGQWEKVQDLKRGSSGPAAIDPFACTDTQWAAWQEAGEERRAERGGSDGGRAPGSPDNGRGS